MEADISSQAVGLASSADFSLMNLFIRADIIVKSVIIILIACSVYSWAVIFEKFKLFKKINQSSEEFETKFWNSKSAESFYNNLPGNINDPMALIFKDAMQNLLKRRSKTDLNARMTSMLETGIEKQMSKITKGFTFLATVGSTAPFVGLFGTVWGIKNAFEEIALQQSTNLAVVAPGIAEALLATALGLLAAIPAVIFYNKLSGDSDKIIAEQESFADEFLLILSRQLESTENRNT
jgi:biopolymer transport protein TolQ